MKTRCCCLPNKKPGRRTFNCGTRRYGGGKGKGRLYHDGTEAVSASPHQHWHVCNLFTFPHCPEGSRRAAAAESRQHVCASYVALDGLCRFACGTFGKGLARTSPWRTERTMYSMQRKEVGDMGQESSKGSRQDGQDGQDGIQMNFDCYGGMNLHSVPCHLQCRYHSVGTCPFLLAVGDGCTACSKLKIWNWLRA
jgi:hypothetical protein